MATKTKREYFCDRCESQVMEKKEMERFFVGHRTLYRNIGFDLCGRCIELFARTLPASVREQLCIEDES